MSAIVAAAALRSIADDGGKEVMDLYAGWGGGIERSANVMEIRLALREYRQRHGDRYWELYAPAMARC